jgi:serine/threonine protein kinase
MHRDIKTTNLMVASYNSVHKIIIDYGSATMEKTSKDHYYGTIAYLAPEVMQLKQSDRAGEPYNCLVDVWSMGLSGYQLFLQESCKWKDGMSSDAHADIVRDLRSS